jgi:hypothetical protein
MKMIIIGNKIRQILIRMMKINKMQDKISLRYLLRKIKIEFIIKRINLNEKKNKNSFFLISIYH